MNLDERMERIYNDLDPGDIPWNIIQPPALLVEAVESGKIQPCRTVDMGCGAGNYAVWLARQGFDVTGIDFSSRAIEYARQLADRENIACRFIVADVFGDLREFRDRFDFAYDWELMHHVFPEDRPRYIRSAHDILRRGGKYLSVAFSEDDPAFGGKGKYRKTPLGTTLYFSSEEELEKLFGQYFRIIELCTIEIPGKHAPHLANVAWLERQ